MGRGSQSRPANGVDPLYIVHFEYDFDKTDLKKTVNTELLAFRRIFMV